jgi:hypothetical protein
MHVLPSISEAYVVNMEQLKHGTSTTLSNDSI